MTTEDNFQAALDQRPDDHHLRLVFADWLDEQDDPRAEGYRAMGKKQMRCSLKGDEYSGREWTWYRYRDYPYTHLDEAAVHYWHAILPDDWMACLCGGEQRNGGRPHRVPGGEWLDWHSRREAEDAAALAFAQLPTERRGELLAENTVA